MKKGNNTYYGILITCFIVFCIICFVIPRDKNGVFWLLLGIAAVMVLLQFYIGWLAAKHSDGKNSFLSFVPYKISIICLALQIILTFVYLFVPVIPAWLCITISVILFGIILVGIFMYVGGETYIDNVEERIKSKTKFITDLKMETAILMNNEQDSKIKRELSSLLEKIRLSDPVSVDGTAEIESKINSKLNDLQCASDKSGIIAEIERLLDERNIRCKTIK